MINQILSNSKKRRNKKRKQYHSQKQNLPKQENRWTSIGSDVIYIIFILLHPINTMAFLTHTLTSQPFAPFSPPLVPHQSAPNTQIDDKNEDMFFKSQVSLAETCQDEHPRNRSFEGDIFDEDCLSMDSQNFCQAAIEAEICQDFLLKGHCMKGDRCQSTHMPNSQQAEKTKKKQRIRIRIWEEIPQICLDRCKRANSFLN